MNIVMSYCVKYCIYPSHLKNELQSQKSNRKKKNKYPKNLKKTTAIDILHNKHAFIYYDGDRYQQQNIT
jgi:hypothetical protein